MEDGMSQEEILETSPELKRPLVVRALRRSNVRKKIAEYLFDIALITVTLLKLRIMYEQLHQMSSEQYEVCKHDTGWKSLF
jgi:hypothetical protein